MKKALIVGCSHALGKEMELEPKFSAEIIDKLERSGRPVETYGATNSFPVLIANNLGCTTTLNHAISGGSNDAMFRIWEQEKNNLNSQDTVIACWTDEYRTEVFHDKLKCWLPMRQGEVHTWESIYDPVTLQGIQVNIEIPDKNLYVEFAKMKTTFESNKIAARTNKIKNILALNLSAQARQIKVINIDSFTYDQLGIQKDITNITWASTESFYTFCEARKYPKTPYNHYFTPAHREFANHCLQQLKSSC